MSNEDQQIRAGMQELRRQGDPIVEPSRWIRFVEGQPAARTRRWTVQTANGNHDLGVVAWIARWRRYGFEPFRNTVYEADCLRDIAKFCETHTELRKSERRLEKT